MRKRFNQNKESRAKTKRKFVNREAELAALMRAVEAEKIDDIFVFNIFALGGQGKTSLVEHFESLVKDRRSDLPVVRFDMENLFNPDDACRDTLLWLYSRLKVSVPGLVFPRYEIAEVTSHVIDKEGSSSFRETVWDVAGSCSFGLAKLVKPIVDSWTRRIPFVYRTTKSVEDWADHFISLLADKELSEFVRFLQAKDRKELDAVRIGAFVSDFEIASRAQGICKGVIILDTYEAMWRGGEQFESVHVSKRDEWVQTLGGLCLGHGILLVIAGREKLLWEKSFPDKNWNTDIKFFDLAGLSAKHADTLVRSRVRNAPHDLCHAIVNYASDRVEEGARCGCHPLTIDLAIEYCMNARNTEGELPAPDSFRVEDGVNPTEHLVSRFLKSLPDGRMQSWLIELSAADHFDDKLALAIDQQRQHAIGRHGWNCLLQYSFVCRDHDRFYRFHRIVNRVLRSKLRARGDAGDVFYWLGSYCLTRDELLDMVFKASLETTKEHTETLLASLVERLASRPIIFGSHYATGLMDAFYAAKETISEKLDEVCKFLVSLRYEVSSYAVMKFVELLLEAGKINAAEEIQKILDGCSCQSLAFARLSELKFLRTQGVSKQLAFKATDLVERDPPPAVKIEAEVLRGDGSREMGSHDRAIESYENALDMFGSCQNEVPLDVICRARLALADLFFVRGMPTRSLGLISAAQEDIDTSLAEGAILEASSFRIEGQVHLSLCEFDEAIRCFQVALQKAREKERPFLIVQSLNSLAEALIARNSSDMAEECLHDAERLGSNINFILEIGKTLYLRAMLALSKQDAKSALDLLTNAESKLGVCGYASGLARIQLVRSEAFLALGEKSKAYCCAREALRYYQKERIYPWLRARAFTILVKSDRNQIAVQELESPAAIEELTTEYKHVLDDTPAGKFCAEQIREFDVIAQRKDYPSFSGYYNYNSKVSVSGEDMLLRVEIQGARRVDVRLIPEPVVLRFLCDHQIEAPRLVLDRKTSSVSYLVYRFIPGTCLHDQIPATQTCPNWIPRSLANKMAAFHQLSSQYLADYCETRYPMNSPRRFIAYLVKELEELHSGWFAKYADFWHKLCIPSDPFEMIRPQELKKDRRFGLCHCDVHRKNIIITSEDNLRIIDWELSLITDPAYEAAVHLHKMRYTEEQERSFLDTYIKKVSSPCSRQGLVADILIHRNLEQVKSAIVDSIRLLDDAQSHPGQFQELVSKYSKKLFKAYQVWNIEADLDRLQKVVASAVVDRVSSRFSLRGEKQ